MEENLVIEQAFQLIRDFLNDKYDPLDFSYDFPYFLIDKYEIMETENKAVNDIFNEEIPEICADYEMGEVPDDFKRKIREEYERALQAIKQRSRENEA